MLEYYVSDTYNELLIFRNILPFAIISLNHRDQKPTLTGLGSRVATRVRRLGKKTGRLFRMVIKFLETTGGRQSDTIIWALIIYCYLRVSKII